MAIKQRPDSPTNNFATLNPLDVNSDGLSNNINNGNLYSSNPDTDYDQVRATFYLKAGKWYWEVLALFTSTQQFGVVQKNYAGGNGERRMYQNNALKYSSSSSSYGAPFTNGDVIGIFLDLDNGEITFYNNGTTQNVAFTDLLTSIDSVGWTPTLIQYNSTAHVNFGQDPSFGGASNLPTGAGDYDTDAAGNSTGGRFAFQPPTGALALCTANLPDFTPTVTGDVPQDYFKAVTYTGQTVSGAMTAWDGTTGTVNVGFQPDFVWIKNRDQTDWHNIVDSVRGATKRISSNNTTTEYDNAANVHSFLVDGFKVGNDHNTNAPNEKYIAWCWKAGGAPTVDNTAISGAMNANGSAATSSNSSVSINGVLQSNYTPAGPPTIYPKRMSINTDAGFSIVKYVGNGSTSGATIPHGLSNAPELVIIKPLNTASLSTNSWGVYHKSAGVGFLNLESTNAYNSTGNRWDSAHPTTSVVSLGGDSSVVHVENNVNYIAYCWHSVEGFSKFGSYTGNGSTDGPFVYCGFRPAFVILKCSSVSNIYTSWAMYDNKRNTAQPAGANPIDQLNILWSNRSDSEGKRGDGTSVSAPNNNFDIDFLSNGFRIPYGNAFENDNLDETFIFMAFAEQPFKYANAR